MNIDLRQLRYFVAVAEERHFGRAATRLAMTQPPLSQQIRALEESLGAPLFARTKRSVELTPVGRDLLPEVRRLLLAADGLRPLAQSLARGETGVLSLAFVSTADYGLLPPLLRQFGETHPGVRLQLVEATSDVQIEELIGGRIDAGLVIPPLLPRHAGRLSYLPLTREPLVIAMSEATAASVGALADTGAISLGKLRDVPLIVFPRRLAPGFYDIIMDCYEAAGCTPRIVQEAIQMQTIVSLVSAGIGVALVPQALCNLRRTGVVYRALREAVPAVETGLMWRNEDASPVLSGFIAVARQFAAAAALA
jgi:DNA-binding transcriptional LysR family regulator